MTTGGSSSAVVRGSLTVHRVYFLESDIVDGDYPRDDTTADEWAPGDLTAAEVVDRIRAEGLTFAATGGSWAASPDGSSIVDYGNGRRVEVSAHLDGWPARVESAIVDAVDR